MKKPIIMSFPETEEISNLDRRMTPEQISAILNLSLLATTNAGPYVDQINIDCMNAISLERDLASALAVVERILETASAYPELSEAVERISELFMLNKVKVYTSKVYS